MPLSDPQLSTNSGSGLDNGGGWSGYGQGAGLVATGSTGGFVSNPDPYAANLNNADAAAQGYYQQGLTPQQQTPQAINEQQGQSQAQLAGTYAGQSALAGQLQGEINNPNSSAASQQFSAGAQGAANATSALGNSAGGGPAAAGARRGAQEQNAVGAAGNVAGLAQVNAGVQQQAATNLSGLYQQQGQLTLGQQQGENQFGQQNAALSQQQGKLNDAAQLGNYGLSANEQGLATGALTGYQNTLLGEAGASNEEQQVNNQFGNQLVGAGLAGAGQVENGASSLYNSSQQPGQYSGYSAQDGF
jgi:hypothetical protein